MDQVVLSELASSGTLRAGLNMGNPLLITGTTPAGDPDGVAPDMAREIAGRLGVAIACVPFASPGELADAAADEANLEIFPVFQNRYNKAVRRVKQAIAAGELGDIRIVSVRVRWCRPQRYYDMAPWRGTFSHDGGALTNQSIHHVDLIRYLGGEVARVNATMRTLGADIEVEDTVTATIQFDGAAIGTVEATTAARPDDF